MRQKYVALAAIIIIVLAGAVYAFSVPGLIVPLQERELKVGFAYALTGAASVLGVPGKAAIQIAVDDINQAGGIVAGNQRYKITPVIEDTRGSPADAVNIATRMIQQDGIKFVLDGGFSGANFAVSPLFVDKKLDGIVFFSASDPGVTDGKRAFRVQFSYHTQDPLQADFFISQGAKKIAAIGYKGHTEFQYSVETFLPKTLKERGADFIGVEFVTPGTKDFAPILGKFQRAGMDGLMCHCFHTDEFVVISQMKDLGLWGKVVYLGHGQADPTSWKPVVGGDFSKISGAYAALPPPVEIRAQTNQKAKEYMDKFIARNPQDFSRLPYADMQHNTVLVLAAAIKKAGTIDDVEKVAQALRELTPADVPGLTINFIPQNGRLFDKAGQAYPELIIGKYNADGTMTTVLKLSDKPQYAKPVVDLLQEYGLPVPEAWRK